MPEVRGVPRSSSVAPLLLASYVFAGGLISFLGYVLDIPRLTDWVNAGISIQPNAAITVMLAGLSLAALWGGRFGFARVLGVLIAAMGGTTLFEHASGIDLGIDGLLLFDRRWGLGGVVVPGRMGPPGATSWTLLGSAIVLASFPSRRRARAAAPGVALAAMSIAGVALTGYLYGATALYAVPTATVIALQTATFIFTASLGLVLSVPEHAPVRLLADRTVTGAVARRVLPAVVVVPIVLGILRLWGERAGLYDLAFGTAMRTVTEIVALSALLWWAAHSIGRQAQARALAEEQLVESLRDADRRKNKFLATLSHELRNPLAPVRSAVALLKGHSRRDPIVDQVSNVIDRQVALMARLLDDLLDIGRITNDRLELRRERADLGAIVRDAIEMCQPLIQGAGHEVSVIGPAQQIVVEADPARLGQVFANLLNNACRYMANKGQIWVTIERSGSIAVVTITDTGMGIPPEQLSSIFEMFSQVDRSNRPNGGLGIGLHLVKRLVEMHRGEVSAHSDGPGMGSRFTVRVPALPETVTLDTTPPAVAPPSAVPQTPRRVLVVDDNADNAELLKILLQQDGHEAFMAHDGVEGLAAAERLRPDVVLMDLGLPRINGLEACRRIRQHPWGKRMLVVAITGWGQDVDRRRSQEAGFDRHLVKPVDARAISDLMKEAAALEQRS